jgi:hypothetical protein
MDTNIYSNNDYLPENIGDALVHWIRKVHEIKMDKPNGSVKNEQSANDRHTDRSSIQLKRNERLERKKTIW